MKIQFADEVENLLATIEAVKEQLETLAESVREDATRGDYAIKSPAQFGKYAISKLDEFAEIFNYYKARLQDMYEIMDTYRELL